MEDMQPQEQQEFAPRVDISAINEKVLALRAEIGKVLVAQDELVQHLLVALLADGHVLLEGLPGVAKTLASKLLAKTIQADFSRVQFTPDLMPSDVVGTNVFNPQKVQFEFRKGPIFSNIVLIDEINRAPAKTQSSLFEVMEERNVTVDGVTHKMDEPFLVVATQNPIEHEGTYQLPEAQLDRFLFKLIVSYPSLQDEVRVLQQHHLQSNLHAAIHNLNAILSKEELAILRQLTRRVVVEDPILEFICRLVAATRTHSGIDIGASPRAGIALLNASKALAALNERDFVIPEDVIQLALPVLRHRISLSAEQELDGVAVDDLLTQLIAGIEVPR
jgi:MoxR-like ATPase